MKNIRIFYLKIFLFLVVKFSIYLNRRVFVMEATYLMLGDASLLQIFFFMICIFFFFFFFFFFWIWVLRPFQEYFTYIEPIVHRKWAKTGEPGEKPPDHP